MEHEKERSAELQREVKTTEREILNASSMDDR